MGTNLQFSRGKVREDQPDPQGMPLPVAQHVELTELRPPVERAAKGALVDLHGPFRALRITLRVCLGDATMSVGDLMDARSGDLVRLGHAIERPVDLVLEGRVVARGELMAIDDEFAVRITEVPLPFEL